VAKTQHDARAAQTPNPDLLAAVVLHTLISKGRDGLSAAHIARACERDPADPSEMREIEVALAILLEDELARRVGELWGPTRPAVRASELSF
jgi:hypothetical protein